MTTSTQWKMARVSDHSEMRVFVAMPAVQKNPLPAVIVLQEAFGVNSHIRDVTQRIASLGYVAAAPEIFHRTAPGFESGYEDTQEAIKHFQAVTDDGLEADLRATYDLLKNDSHVDGSRIAAAGFCMGGRAAFLAGTILPLSCAVSYYGGGIAERHLSQVKDLHSPILLVWAGKDERVGPKQHYATVDALRQAGKIFVDVEFSDAGHGFFCDARKSYHPVAAAESWGMMAAFLERNLKA